MFYQKNYAKLKRWPSGDDDDDDDDNDDDDDDDNLLFKLIRIYMMLYMFD